MASAVVAGFDGSATTRQAARHAATPARGGTLVVVHAREHVARHLPPRWRDIADGLAGIEPGTRMADDEPADAMNALMRRSSVPVTVVTRLCADRMAAREVAEAQA
jgi:hypothetical protein